MSGGYFAGGKAKGKGVRATLQVVVSVLTKVEVGDPVKHPRNLSHQPYSGLICTMYIAVGHENPS